LTDPTDLVVILSGHQSPDLVRIVDLTGLKHDVVVVNHLVLVFFTKLISSSLEERRCYQRGQHLSVQTNSRVHLNLGSYIADE
jgi:hypothetical protein